MGHAWIDASAGVAGDMLLGALVDAGADLGAVQAAVEQVVPAAVRLAAREVHRAGQRATHLTVEVLVDDPPHRTWTGIRARLLGCGLADPVRTRALAVFARLAQAEGRVHGIPADEVHFHEVGALDSIADVVGTCAALVDLGVETVSVGPIALGSGRTHADHGDLPVPVPAVTELVRGWAVRGGGPGELATPTGAALVTALGRVSEELPALRLERVGVGAGTRDTPGRPNVTRVLLGEPEAAAEPTESMVELESNVDDLDPRLWPVVLDRLLAAGAADAWLTPILMKKGRPAHTVSVLCHPGDAGALRDLLYTHTTTLGVRVRPLTRHALERRWFDVDTFAGAVSVKVGARAGTVVQVTPEFESVARAAAASGASVRRVLREAEIAAGNAGLVPGAALPERV